MNDAHRKPDLIADHLGDDRVFQALTNSERQARYQKRIKAKARAFDDLVGRIEQLEQAVWPLGK